MARLSEDIRRWTSDILSFPIKRYYVELISMCRNEYAGQEPAASRTPLAIVASYHSERGGRTAFATRFPSIPSLSQIKGISFFHIASKHAADPTDWDHRILSLYLCVLLPGSPADGSGCCQSYRLYRCAGKW